jgi:hypothetical protein
MDILDNGEQRRPRCQAAELGQERRQCHFLAPLRTELRRAVAVAGRYRQQVGQRHHDAVGIGVGPRERRLELCELLCRQVAPLEPRSPFELADERIQRAVGVMRRTVLAHRDVRFVLEPRVKRERNVRLADTGLAGEHHRATLAKPGLMPAPQQHLDFLVAPDRRRQPGLVLRFETAFHFGRRQHLPGWYRLRPSLEHDGSETPAFEMPVGEPVRTLGNQHGPGIGERLQARG